MAPCHTSHHTAVILQDTLQKCHAALQKLGISLFSSHCSLFLGSYLIFHTHLTPAPTQPTLGTWHLFSWFVMSWILDFERAVIEFFKTNQMVNIQLIHRMAEAGRCHWKSSASLLRVCSTSLFRLLMIMFNSTELRISPWDTPPVAGVQLNLLALVTILRALQLLPFSMPFTVHFLVCTSLACLQGWMGCRAESLTAVSNIPRC